MKCRRTRKAEKVIGDCRRCAEPRKDDNVITHVSLIDAHKYGSQREQPSLHYSASVFRFHSFSDRDGFLWRHFFVAI